MQAEVAKRWRLSPRTLERWRSEGRGPAWLKIGGQVRYRASDLAAWEDTQLRRPARQPAAPIRLTAVQGRRA
jgi:hypothetical protein